MGSVAKMMTGEDIVLPDGSELISRSGAVRTFQFKMLVSSAKWLVVLLPIIITDTPVMDLICHQGFPESMFHTLK